MSRDVHPTPSDSGGPVTRDTGAPPTGDGADQVCDRFARAWQEGERPSIRACLNEAPEAEHAALLRRLLPVELRYRRRGGETLILDEYRQRFPEHGALVAEIFEDLVAATAEAWSSEWTESGVEPRPAAGAPPAFPGYDLLGELGRGGMGVVYRAYDRKRGRHVALKTMQGLDPAALSRFKQEFRRLADLAHPHLVTLYDLLSDGRQWCFTMELVEGTDFFTYVRAADGGGSETTVDGLTPAQLGRLRACARQLAEGVLALHEHGTLHRDIKPGNVLVTKEGRVVLLDFGLAADLDRAGLYQSTVHHLVGTALYMAPEQAACEPVSPASDWYALGVMLYQALTGRAPFEGRFLEVLTRKQQTDPLPPGELALGVPEDLNQLCVDLLRRDPRARPSGGEILRRLGAQVGEAAPAVAPKSLPGSGMPFIGRERHLEALTAAFRRAQQGRTVCVYVHGRSGAGKSALVQHFLEEVAGPEGAVILAGRCYERESVPYKALDSLVDALNRYLRHLPVSETHALLPRDVAALARVFPVLQWLEGVVPSPRNQPEVSDPQGARRRALAGLRELLARVGDRRPLVLFIDDLQWGDVDSAELLADVLRPPDAPVLLLIGSYRSEDRARSAFLRAFQERREPCEGPDCREMAVEPLDPVQGQQLAAALLEAEGAAAAERAEAIARESAGNPFFIHQLVQHLRAGGGCAEPVAAPSGNVALGDVLWSRVRCLPEDARRLLEVVAVAGRPLTQQDACGAADLDPAERAGLQGLRAARLIRGTGSTEREEIETYHDRIRETVVARLSPEALREHHRRLAAVLEAGSRTDPEVLATHFREAGDGARAGKYYAEAAAQAARTLAFDRAAKLYRLALQWQTTPGPERHRLCVQLGDALAHAGRGGAAAEQYLAAARDVAGPEQLELQRRAALQFLSSGRVEDGLATLRSVLGSVGMRMPATPLRALGSLVWRRAQLRLRGLGHRGRAADPVPTEQLARLDVCLAAAIGLSMIDTVQGACFQTRALLLALQAGEPMRLARALAMEAAHVAIGGGASRRRTGHLLQVADVLARQVEHPYVYALVSLAREIAAALAGDWREACAAYEQAEGTFRTYCTGVMWELGTAHRFMLWPLMFRGEVAEIAARLPLLVQEAQERDDLYSVTNLALGVRTFLRLATDEPERAREELDQVMARWTPHGFHVQHMNRLYDEAQIDLYLGNGLGAWGRLTEQWPALARSHLLRVQQVRVFMHHLRARSALAAAGSAGDPAPFLRAAERDAGLLRRERVAWAEALAHLIEAGVAACRDDRARAQALLADAAKRCDASDMHLYAWAARRRAGELTANEAGAATVAQADAWMTGQKIRRPDRMTALLVPGFVAKKDPD